LRAVIDPAELYSSFGKKNKSGAKTAGTNQKEKTMRAILNFYAVVILLALLVGGDFVGTARAAEGQGDNASAYRIGAGDLLEITTWKEEDFTREVMVRLDGFITFPLLDDIMAAGMTPMDLKAEITKKLSQFVEGPQVTVSVKEPASKKFYVLGEVARTGEYSLNKELTVLQAFALAGGFTEWASKKEILLLRRENGQERVFRINYKAIVGDQELGENLKLQPDDTIVVP
jgi:polysaccharide export outer membrane protein